jgi:hypothetical protein
MDVSSLEQCAGLSRGDCREAEFSETYSVGEVGCLIGCCESRSIATRGYDGRQGEYRGEEVEVRLKRENQKKRRGRL